MHGKIFSKQKLIVIILSLDQLKKLGFYLQRLVEMKWKEQFKYGKKNQDIKIINLKNI